jgi:hypothetical protein
MVYLASNLYLSLIRWLELRSHIPGPFAPCQRGLGPASGDNPSSHFEDSPKIGQQN